jgi:hypothetical protein
MFRTIAILATSALLMGLGGCATGKGEYRHTTITQAGGRTAQLWVREAPEPRPYALEGEQPAQPEQRHVAQRREIGGRPKIQRTPVSD